MNYENRIGEVRTNKQGCKMKILTYLKYDNITIEFQDENKYIISNATYNNFKKGTIKNPYFPSIFNLGYIGLTTVVDKFGKIKPSYTCWHSMLERCLSNKIMQYIDVVVCDEWHSYENFEKWYNNNYWECGDEKMSLDKDILFKGNKIYSPKTCIFVPKRINSLFTNRKNYRGKYPLGVYKKNKKYNVRFCDGNGNRIYKTGKYTPEETFYIYKIEREKIMQKVADEYIGKYNNFPINLYNAICSWEVEISD